MVCAMAFVDAAIGLAGSGECWITEEMPSLVLSFILCIIYGVFAFIRLDMPQLMPNNTSTKTSNEMFKQIRACESQTIR